MDLNSNLKDENNVLIKNKETNTIKVSGILDDDQYVGTIYDINGIKKGKQ